MTINNALNAEWREFIKSEDRRVTKPSMTAARAKMILDCGETSSALVAKMVEMQHKYGKPTTGSGGQPRELLLTDAPRQAATI